MSAADILLSRLDGVRKTGSGKWMAKCPSHEDRSPSLSIRETKDGTLLVHCFAGCSASDVVVSVGLSLGDLFPSRPDDNRRKPERRPFPAADILKAISTECLVVVFAAEDMARDIPLTDADKDRLTLAASRIQEGILAGVLHG